MKATVAWKVYGTGSEQLETYEPSFTYDFSTRIAPRKLDTRIIRVFNYDRTGTHEYAEVHITRNTLAECYREFSGQLTDGIFENYYTGHTEVLWEKAPRSQLESEV